MPLACMFSHVPDAGAALLIDGRLALTSCARCGSGLFDKGEGWASPLSSSQVLRRPATAAPRTRRHRRRGPPAEAATRAACLGILLLASGAFAGLAPHALA